jgi:hypothetical protein
MSNHRHHGAPATSACPAVAAIDLFNRTFVAARPSGYPGGRNNRSYGSGKTCMIRYIQSAHKWGFAIRALKNPLYGFRAWQHFCAIPAV